MKVSECSKIRHVLTFFLHLLNSSISLCETLVHVTCQGSHSCFDFFNCFNMSIVFLLLYWFGVNWFVGKSFLVHSNFLFNSGSTGVEHLLELFGFGLSFSNCLNMFSIFINCWIFSFLLFFFCFFFCGVFSFLFLLFGSCHFSPWFILGY